MTQQGTQQVTMSFIALMVWTISILQSVLNSATPLMQMFVGTDLADACVGVQDLVAQVLGIDLDEDLSAGKDDLRAAMLEAGIDLDAAVAAANAVAEQSGQDDTAQQSP